MGIRRLANFYKLVADDLENNPLRERQLGDYYLEVLEDIQLQRSRAVECLGKIEAGSNTC
jgi:hypothetical protein